MTNQVDALRAVIDAARKWASTDTRDEAEDAGDALQDAVERLEKVLKEEGEKRSRGFVVPSTWGELLKGYFVRTPNLKFFEVTTVYFDEKMRFMVGLKDPESGKVGVFPRDPAGQIKIRKHSRTDPTAEALEALSAAFPGTTIIRDGDEPPWND